MVNKTDDERYELYVKAMRKNNPSGGTYLAFTAWRDGNTNAYYTYGIAVEEHDAYVRDMMDPRVLARQDADELEDAYLESHLETAEDCTCTTPSTSRPCPSITGAVNDCGADGHCAYGHCQAYDYENERYY